jgi:hypothetical protein
MIPDLDWTNAFQDDDFVQSQAQAQDQQVPDDQQEFQAERVFIPSSRTLHFTVYTKVGDDEDGITLSWSIEDSKEFDVTEYPVPSRNEDHLHQIDRIIPARGLVGDCMKPSIFWDFVSDRDAHKYVTTILSWFFDDELKLFIIKRDDGCQYLKPMRKYFRSLSESDLMDLGRKRLVNPSGHGYADYFSRKLQDDYRKRFYDNFDKTSVFIAPRSLKKVTKDDGTIEFVQRPIKRILKVPVKKWPQDVLSTLDHWEIHRDTGEALMYGDRDKRVILLRVFDPMQIVNLSRDDQRRLYDTECLFRPSWTTEESRYRKILRICLHANIHANSRRLLFDG